jgi:FkbM family methyltransferase
MNASRVADVALPELRETPWWVAPAASVIKRLPAGRYRAMNWVARRSAHPFWARMPLELGSQYFQCDLRDRIMREVCLTGRYEPQETALLQQILRPGMTVVDVGANWGYFTLCAAHLVGSTGRVVSIEVDPRACRTLKANIERNALQTVTVLEMAASDTTGVLRLHEYEDGANDSGNFGLNSANTSATPRRQFEAPASPIDDVLDKAGIEQVDVLKMDIEGAEGRALDGLQRALADRRIRFLVLELHPEFLRNQGTSVERVVATLRGYGYRAWKIDHSPASHRRVASGEVDVTTLLTPLGETDDLGPWPHLLWA